MTFQKVTLNGLENGDYVCILYPSLGCDLPEGQDFNAMVSWYARLLEHHLDALELLYIVATVWISPLVFHSGFQVCMAINFRRILIVLGETGEREVWVYTWEGLFGRNKGGLSPLLQWHSNTAFLSKWYLFLFTFFLWHWAGLHLPLRHNYYFIIIFSQLSGAFEHSWIAGSFSGRNLLVVWLETIHKGPCVWSALHAFKFLMWNNKSPSQLECRDSHPTRGEPHFYLLFIGRNISCRRYSNHTFI